MTHAHLGRPYRLDKDRIHIDLKDDRPRWILSSYSPSSDTPRQLFGGQLREKSFEELRLRHYELAANGQEQQAIQEAKAIYDNAEQQMVAAANDLDGAIKYIIQGENEHPNRIDICREVTKGSSSKHGTTNTQPPPSMKTFGASFGQPSHMAQPSAFGQPPALGQPLNSFVMNQPQQSSFGRPSPLGTGQANPFAQPKNPFSSTRNVSQPRFGNLPFSISATTTSTAPSPMDVSTSQPSSFAATSALGKIADSATNPFTNPGPTSSLDSFSQNKAPTVGFTNSLPTTQLMTGTPNYGQKNAQGQLTSWKGSRISYIDGAPCFRRSDGNWEKVWFPEAPKLDMNEVIPNAMYTEALEERYKYMLQHGAFPDGLIPDMPPKKEWCLWDF